jgi:antirestriction protein ArdC
MSRNLYREVTDRILTELRNGALPWVKPWSSIAPSAAIPQNALTQRPYSGMNVVLLWGLTNIYPTARFLTYKQALQCGGSVKKGEKGYSIYFFGTATQRDGEGDEDDRKAFRFLRYYTVFNVAQCENLPNAITGGKRVKPRNLDKRDVLADEFTSSIGADVREGHGEAYYAPGKDFVSMPGFLSFSSADSFYSTLFHELGHWTGHEKRLDRVFGKFGSQGYAAEELTAELTAAFLCAEFGFDNGLRHAGYIEHWIKLLTDHDKAFVNAAAQAQKAADFMRSKALQESHKLAA